MDKLQNAKMPRWAILLLFAVIIAASVWFGAPKFQPYFIYAAFGLLFALIVFGSEVFKQRKQNWANIIGVGFAMIVISFIVWGISRSDVLNKQQEAAPAIANTPCEVVLTIVGLQWQQGQAPIEHCDSVTNVESLIESQTETFGETDWAERQIIALLGPNKDQWNTGALLVERTAYVQELHAHQNARFTVDLQDWTSLFVIAILMPFGISILGFIKIPYYEKWGPFAVLFVPLGAYLVLNWIYEEMYLGIYLSAVVVEFGAVIVPIFAGKYVFPKIRNIYATYLLQAALSSPGYLFIVYPWVTNIVSSEINMTMGIALDVLVLGYFSGKGVISSYYFIQAWMRGEA